MGGVSWQVAAPATHSLQEQLSWRLGREFLSGSVARLAWLGRTSHYSAALEGRLYIV